MSSLISKINDYFLTKRNSLDQSIQLIEKLLDKIDTDKLLSAKTQLKDI